MIKRLTLGIKTKVIFCLVLIVFYKTSTLAQISNQPGINGIQTYVNPVLPGDHPDQTLMRVGKDFYSTGSNFHFTPYLPILHSTDLMHWEVIARVIPPTSSIPNNDTPSGGTWQGALAQFNNKFWVYFSNNAGGGQYFCNATNMAGPWSAPVKVNTNTGVYGYDNSIFVDDDGTPYMLLKNGQDLNGLQKLGMDGQPSGQALNMNWINANGHPYSWAEGPVMCKRNGRYYIFVAGNVTGGQYVLSSAKLSNVESDWTRHGNFWQTSTGSGGFTGPNHITQPIKLDDGTWWCLSHAYDNGGWEGQGRQSHLHQVIWDANGVPKGIPVSVNPVQGPNLPASDIDYEFIRSDYFESTTLSLNWHFLSKVNAATSKYSLSERPGYMRLKPGTGYTHVLQKDKGKYYSLTTKVDLNATANGQQAGIRMTSGKDDVTFTLYTGYNNGKKIGMAFQGVTTEVNNAIGTTVWLRVERALHILTCYYSADGLAWTQLGTKDVSNMDKSQADYNAWVGTSVGLYASAASADFDQFSYRYGFVPIRVEGRNNWYGVTFANRTPGRVVTNSTSGDWLMLAGVDLGSGSKVTTGIEVNASSASSTGSLEVWLDNIGGTGTKISTIAIANTGGNDVWSNVTSTFSASGQHDVYLRWVGAGGIFSINTIRFLSGTAAPVPVVTLTAPTNNAVYTEGDNITVSATATITSGTISKVDFYNGTTLLGTDATSPYTYTISTAAAGTYTITAKATSAANATGTSSAVSVQVAKPVYQTGAAPTIDGTVETLWNNFTSSSISKTLSGTVSSSADLSGNWKAMWDAANLYVLVQVTDDVKKNDGGTDVYNDDNVEIYIDMGNTKATTYGTNDQQYTFRWNDATAVYEINGHSVTGITRGITNTTTGYIVEVSIPWSTMGGTASVNALEGFDVMLNDDDDGGARDGKMAWAATTDDTWSNPSLMGTIILKGLNCTAPTAAITTTTATTFCQGGSVVLTASTGTGNTYVWKNGTAVIAGATEASYTATAAGSYTVTITNSGGCSATSAATTVTVNALPTVTPYAQLDGGAWTQTGTGTVCAGSTVVLGPQPTVTTGWSWTGPGGYAATTREITLNTITANQGGTYTASYTDGNGCKASAAYTVTVNALPATTITTSTSTTFCSGGSVVLTASAGSSYKWMNGSTVITGATAQTYTATAAGSYTVEVSNAAGCKATSAATTVTVSSSPTAAITASTATTFCAGGSVVLTASAGSSYKWMNGSTAITGATAQTYTATAAGSYTVEVSNAAGCKATSTATTVTVSAVPTAAITTTTPTSFCAGGSVVLTASAGSSYKWMNGSTAITGATAQTYTATTAGNYTVEVSNAGNCKATSAATVVTVNASPNAPAVTSAVSYCQNGTAVALTATGTGLKWYADNTTTTALASAPTPSTAAAGTTNYYVSQTTNGCESARSQIEIIVNALPTATITTTTPTFFCSGGSVVFTSSTGTSYIWKNGSTTMTGATAQSYTATAAGSYTVEVGDASGCKATSSATVVTVNDLPLAMITASGSTNIPAGGSVDLNANTGSGFTYKWFKGSNQVGIAASYTATEAGVYTVEVTNAAGCSTTSASTAVNINTNKPSQITITSPSTNTSIQGAITITADITDPDGSIVLVEYLDGNKVIGTSTSAPYSFDWSDPSSGDHVITVRVTDSNGGITVSAPVTVTSEPVTTGVQSSGTLNAHVYPNPSNGIVFIDSDTDLSGASFMLVDVMGNEHQITQSTNGLGMQIDVSNLSDGAYVLIIKKDNSVMRKKITVIK